MPTDAGDGFGRCPIVAGQHHDLDALGMQQAPMASAVVSLIGSATPTMPAARPSMATNITVCPSRRSSSAFSFSESTLDRQRLHHLHVADGDAPALDVPITPLPVTDSKSGDIHERDSALLGTGDDGGGERMLAHVLEACDQPQQRCSSIESALTTVTSRGLPSVSVPVLSTTSVVTFSRISSASALRISTPASAPRPVPTMIDIGVARPSAHGHAMISTATAFTSACASRGSGPHATRRRTSGPPPR